jgi:large subunit ribosomal protein L10
MPLTRTEKADIIDDLAERLDDANYIYVTNFMGLSVAQTNELRTRFREAGVDYKVCKNTLMQMAIDRVDGYRELEEHLHGPTAIAIADEPAKPARVIKDFIEDEGADRPELKAAYIEGEMYGADQLDALASLQSQEEIVGEIISLLTSPVRSVVSALNAPGQALVTIIGQQGEDE